MSNKVAGHDERTERRKTVAQVKEIPEQSDADLVARCRDGDRTAFDDIVRRYGDRIVNTLLRLLGNREDAYDAAQETFVRAYRGIEQFRGEAQLSTWLYRIATNVARNRFRDGSRKGRDRVSSIETLSENAPQLADAAAQTDRPDAVAIGRELEDALQRCLDELPETLRAAFVFRVIDGMTYEEIARVLDCPRGTVKSRLNQARRTLRKRLAEQSLI